MNLTTLRFLCFTGLFCFLFSLSLVCNAQTFHEVGIGTGLVNYKGEMSRLPNLSSPGLGANFFYRANISPVVSLRASAFYGTARQDDAKSSDTFAKTRNHAFKTDIIEFAGTVEYNFFNISVDNKSRQMWTPYLFAGMGYFFLNSKTNIQPTYVMNSISIPFGAGVKFLFNERAGFHLEFGARKTFTDFIDDLAVNANQARPLQNPVYYTGNTNDRDMFFFTNLSFSLYLNKRTVDCPVKIPSNKR